MLMKTRWQMITGSSLWRAMKMAWARWAEVDGDQRAASFAYYLLLSILPLTILLVTAGSLFVDRDVATQALVKLGNRHTVLTAEQETYVIGTIHDMLDARGRISMVTIPLLLWGALKFLRTLIRTTNRVWKSPAYRWFRLPLKSLGLLAVTMSAVLFGLVLPGWARLLQPLLTNYIDFPRWAFALFFHLIPWLVLFYGLLMIYRLAPSRPTKFSEVWLGALGTTVLIRSGEWLFLVYSANFAQFNVLYGAVGGIVIFLLWLYVTSCLGIFGICFCAAQSMVSELSDRNSQKTGASEPSKTRSEIG